MTTITELKDMLDILNIDTLNQLNTSIIHEEPYSWGRTPLLKYAPEALADYADAIYQHVIAPLDPDTATDDDLNLYVAQYLTFYEQAETAFTSASVDLAHRLLTISRTPIKPELPPNFIDEGDNVYNLIADYFDGKSYDLYPHFSNFLYSYLSPLRRADLIAHDQRLIDLVKDADKLIAPYNAALDAFIRRELRRLHAVVKDRIRYTKLKPADIEFLKLNKHRIPADDWQSINQAINTRSLSASTLKMVKHTLQDLKTAPPAKSTPPAKPAMSLSAYLPHFMDSLEVAYAKLMAKRANAYANGIQPIDDIIAGYHASQHAVTQGINIDDIEAAQAKGREFFSNFANFRPVLSACLQIDLYNLSVDSIFTPDILSHNVVQGILAFTAKLRPHAKYRSLTLMYDRLAEELYSSISKHTCGFADALPLPDIAPLSDDVIAITPKAPRIAPDSKPLRFDLTQPIQDILSTLGADVVTTDTVVLSAPLDPSNLMTVDDPTLKNIACRLTGMDSAPYLLDGGLLIYNPKTDQYLKVLPTIREDGYADYVFTAYNIKALKDRLNGLQSLLSADPRYRSSLSPCITHIPQGDPVARQKAIKDMQELADILLAQVNDLYKYDADDYDGDTDYVVTKRTIRQIVQTPYYRLFYLSAHRLAAYVYYPKDYSTYIAAKPTDPITGKPLVYHVHHKDGCRSNNRPENLEIVPKQTNDTRRSTSRPVIYKGIRYDYLKVYCEDTNAGAYDKLTSRLASLSTTTPVIYNGRVYTIDVAGIIAVTDDANIPVITYKDSVYATPKAFADAQKLPYKSLHNVLSKARKEGKDRFVYKQYNFYLDNNGYIVAVSK
jgi:hypothetical protein